METTETITVMQFILKHKIDFTRRAVSTRPDGLMADQPMRHWQFRIKHGTRGFNLYFSQGYGHTEPPTFADVLDCLASDASGYENTGTPVRGKVSRDDVFHNWCAEYGYSSDSRKAEKILKTVKRQAEQLKRTLGAEAYQELLYNTERL